MKYSVDQITRVYAVRVLIWEKRHENICPYSFVVGKNNDGSCYFRNPYTEYPNELKLRDQKEICDFFEKTIRTIESIADLPEEKPNTNADEVWNFHVWYKNGEEEDINCKNRKVDIHFAKDNDIMNNTISGIGSGFFNTMITLDELKDEVVSGYVDFDKFFYFIKWEYVGTDDYSFVRYERQDDGGVIIYAGNYYGRMEGDPYIVIDQNGYITESYANMYYVALLKKAGIKIIIQDQGE